MKNPNFLPFLALLAACSPEMPDEGPDDPPDDPMQPELNSFHVVNRYPHDPAAFTQGLVFHEGHLYEGTGRFGQSSLRQVELATGVVLRQVALEQEFFGEGITIWEDEVFQLTWRSGRGFVYDLETLGRVGEFTYPTEGWGLTHDGERLIQSDGTSTLYFLDPETLQETGRVEVSDGSEPVTRLNELEYIDGEVFANIWLTDQIVRIDPDSGEVLGWIDLTGLLPPEDRTGSEDVLNGIAYDAGGDRLFVTGKLWPELFEIELVPEE